MKKIILLICIICICFSLTSCDFFDPYENYNTYIDNLEIIKNNILNDCVVAEEIGNSAVEVWNNAIYEVSDSKTDKYTKSGKKFVDDFNKALNSLYSYAEIKDKISLLNSNSQAIKDQMKDMQSPPKGLEKCYDILTEYYLSYEKFYEMVISPTGSLNSFSKSFNETDTKTIELYKKLDIQIPNKKKF